MSESSPLSVTDQCRICLDDDKPSNMIFPCRCAGTNLYVHDHCLKQWIILSENPEYKTKCPTCQYTYKMNRPNINEDVIKCNSVYIYLSQNFWTSLMFHQLMIVFSAFFIGAADMSNGTYPNYPLYNATEPIITSVTEFQSNPFFVYYSFTCILYTVLWILVITTNIALLRRSTFLYIKKMNCLTIIISPMAFYVAVYLNMISLVFGTFILTRLIQLWVTHHLHTVQLMKSVQSYEIANYGGEDPPV